jgi:hypothetical protein
VLLGVLMTACSSGGSSTCTAQVGAPLLIYPANGAGGVSTTVGELIVANAASGTTLSLVTGSSTVNATPLHPAAPPYPSGVPTPAPGQTYSVANIPALSSATTYTVKSGVPEPCGHLTLSFTIGQFTTQ